MLIRVEKKIVVTEVIINKKDMKISFLFLDFLFLFLYYLIGWFKMVYDKKIIDDYLNGRNVEDIEGLKKDPNFIFEATIHSGDKEMYNSWNSKMKKNYLYVRKMLFQFYDDLKFSNKVTLNYLKRSKVDEKFLELCVIMLNMSFGIDKEMYECYDGLCSDIYDDYMDEIASCDNYEGMGFNCVRERFDSKVIVDYFATRFVSEIFTSKYLNNCSNLDVKDLIALSDPCLDEYLSNEGISNVFCNGCCKKKVRIIEE